MRKADIEKYKRTLLDMKSRLQGSVEGMRREALEAEDGSPSDDDPADHGTTHYDQDLTLSLLEDRHETMKRIDAALARVEDGKFGTCEGCNAPIARARLEALPHARLCVDCQERLDELG